MGSGVRDERTCTWASTSRESSPKLTQPASPRAWLLMSFLVSWLHSANVAAPQCTHLREGAEGARAGKSEAAHEASGDAE